MDLFGGPAADVSAALQEDTEETDDARVVDLDAGVANRADGDREGEALQQREVDVDVQPLCLETSETAGDVLEPLANGVEMIQSLLDLEIGELLETSSLRRKVANFACV